MGFQYRNKKDGALYFLLKKKVKLRSKIEREIYYFSKKLDNKLFTTMPEGYEVWENPNTGMPLLKKIK